MPALRRARRLRLRAARQHSPKRLGTALFLVMFFTAAIGTFALSAIYLNGTATLLSQSYDKESQLKYAAEAGLAIGKARLNFNPAALPSSSYVALLTNQTLRAADNQPINGISVSVYAGPTGSTTGQFGRFASVVAVAKDAQGIGFVRRLELTQESFAKYAYWSNLESNGSGVIYFAGGDQLWGPVWSNDTISINSTGATFFSTVGTAKVINGASYGTFHDGYAVHQAPITLPSNSALATLSGLATSGGFNFTAPTTGDETTVLMRIEFVATDINGLGDSTAANDGFFRVYTANANKTAWLRSDWPAGATAAQLLNCGDWHTVAGYADKKFFPAAIHKTSWFRQMVQAGGMTNTAAKAESSATAATIMQEANARCYPGGDPHLVAVERTPVAYPTAATRQKGGDDTTFTPTDSLGSWRLYSATPNATVAGLRADANYLFPLYRGLNPGTKGVIYSNGTVAISGVVGGQITLYSPNTIVIIDDVRYANDPGLGLCADVLGIISGTNVVIADNAINTPQLVKTTLPTVTRSLDDTKDLYVQGVIMALNTSFEVQNYNTGPTAVNNCGTTTNGRGCLYLTGGLIQQSRGAVGTSTGTGFAKVYSYDACAATNPPPYFPTTGVFEDNRYYELDPANFNIATLFSSLTPGG